MSAKVITYQSPSNACIELTQRQIKTLSAARVWPRDGAGQEFCSVSHGLHTGTPTFSDDDIAAMIAASK